MINVNQCTRRAVQVTACTLVGLAGLAGCAGSSANPPPAAPMSAAPAPVNGTFDGTNATINGGNGDAQPSKPTSMATMPSAGTPASPTPPPDAPLTDGQIAMIVSDVNRSEIDAGKLAQSHGKNAKVKMFAQHMVTGHSAVESQLMTLEKGENIAPADSPISTKLVDQNQSTKQSLEAQSGNDFDRAYIAAQLQGHQDVLDLIDNKLLPQAQDTKLKASLASIRTKVVDHIQMAKDAQAALPSA